MGTKIAERQRMPPLRYGVTEIIYLTFVKGGGRQQPVLTELKVCKCAARRKSGVPVKLVSSCSGLQVDCAFVSLSSVASILKLTECVISAKAHLDHEFTCQVITLNHLCYLFSWRFLNQCFGRSLMKRKKIVCTLANPIKTKLNGTSRLTINILSINRLKSNIF